MAGPSGPANGDGAWPSGRSVPTRRSVSSAAQCLSSPARACPYAVGVTQDFGGLAATGSDVTPWLIIAGIVVLLGVIALVVAGVIRSRRAERRVEDAAAVVAGAGGVLPEPDANAPESAETVIQEASELGATDAGALGTEGSTPPAGGSGPTAPGDGPVPGDAPKD